MKEREGEWRAFEKKNNRSERKRDVEREREREREAACNSEKKKVIIINQFSIIYTSA